MRKSTGISVLGVISGQHEQRYPFGNKIEVRPVSIQDFPPLFLSKASATHLTEGLADGIIPVSDL
jgi:hypothetical protein